MPGNTRAFPNSTANSAQSQNGNFAPPPSAAFDRMGIDSPIPPSTASTNGPGGAGADASAGGGGSASGERVCPHCTFVNEAGRSDCDICGLPLDG